MFSMRRDRYRSPVEIWPASPYTQYELGPTQYFIDEREVSRDEYEAALTADVAALPEIVWDEERRTKAQIFLDALPAVDGRFDGEWDE